MLMIPDPEEKDADVTWMKLVASAWHEELSDPREDIYTMDDGQEIEHSE